MASPRPQDVFETGELVNNTYRIERVLGRGGMGEVYLASHDVTNEQFAIKVMRSELTDNELGVELMKREQAVRTVYHDAVIKYFELGRTANRDIYLVMDFVEGEPLDKLFKHKPMSVEEVLSMGRAVAAGLAACHEQNVIHRDLSPDNILLRGNRIDQPVIIDFGIAKSTAANAQTVIGDQFAGKYTYAPPEQFRGHVDERSDLYALGMTMLAAFRGRAPDFGSNDFQVFENKARPLDLSDVPEPLRSVLADLTDPDPNRRPVKADVLVERIDAVTAALVSDERTMIAPGAVSDRTVVGSVAPRARAVPRPAPPGPGGEAPLELSQATRIAPPIQTRRPEPAYEDRAEIHPTRGPRGGRNDRAGGGGRDDGGARSRRREREEEPRRRGGGMMILLLLLLLIGGGVGAWFSGLIPGLGGPQVVDPYQFRASLSEDGRISVSGYVPDGEARSRIDAFFTSTYQAADVADALSLGAGAPTPDLASDVLRILGALEPLLDWTMTLEANRVRAEGLAPDTQTARAVEAALAALDGRGGLSLFADISAGPRILTDDALADVLARGGCGPLTLAPTPPGGVPLDGSVTINGSVANGAAGLELRERLQEAIGSRTLDLRIEVLNRPVCAVRQLLPPVAQSDLRIWFGFGGGGADRPNPSGAYAVGENPLIDIRLPLEASWGHLHVTAVDVTGAVFHLMPNTYRPTTLLEELGEVVGGERQVRVAHTVAARAADPTLPAFVIDETFGKTLVVAFHTREPLFDTLRPIAESSESFAAALEDRIARLPLTEAEIATRMIDTRID